MISELNYVSTSLILFYEYIPFLICSPFHSRYELRDCIQNVFQAFPMNEFRSDHAVIVLIRGKIYLHSESPLYLSENVANRSRIEA